MPAAPQPGAPAASPETASAVETRATSTSPHELWIALNSADPQTRKAFGAQIEQKIKATNNANPEIKKQPPESLADVVAWADNNPGERVVPIKINGKRATAIIVGNGIDQQGNSDPSRRTVIIKPEGFSTKKDWHVFSVDGLRASVDLNSLTEVSANQDTIDQQKSANAGNDASKRFERLTKEEQTVFRVGQFKIVRETAKGPKYNEFMRNITRSFDKEIKAGAAQEARALKLVERSKTSLKYIEREIEDKATQRRTQLRQQYGGRLGIIFRRFGQNLGDKAIALAEQKGIMRPKIKDLAQAGVEKILGVSQYEQTRDQIDAQEKRGLIMTIASQVNALLDQGVSRSQVDRILAKYPEATRTAVLAEAQSQKEKVDQAGKNHKQ
ncbi:hypothetical protein JW962_00310 [Candidatus Dojkabacteria bacterium]|nr:hypothetical protein [Candidatus Dojkabacteria bacterium]